MRKFVLGYLLPRFAQWAMVIFIGVTVTFIIPRLSPNDPVERQIGQMMTSGAQVDPAAVIHMREALTEMYGLKGSRWQQYLAFWGRLFRGDLGPSLSTFPTPVTELIARAMPWTLGLLVTAVLISWILGNAPRRLRQLLSKESPHGRDRRAQPGGAADPVLRHGAGHADHVRLCRQDLSFQRRLPAGHTRRT